MGLKWTTSTNSYEIIDTDIRSKATIILDGPLRSVGDACDRVFLDKDRLWKIERSIGQDIIGTITSIVDVGGISGFEHQPLNRKKLSMILADRATHGVGENTFHITETATVFLGEAGDTISDINAKYSGMEVLYELAEPTITTLDNELQHLLNNIPSYEGDTYVHTSGGPVRPYLYGRFLTSVGSQVSDLGQRVQSAEVKIEPSAIVATVRESVAYQGDLSGLDGKIDGVESQVSDLGQRVQSAEVKIEPSAIVATVRESVAYQGDLSGLDGKIDGVETRVSTAESKITPQAITQTVTDSGAVYRPNLLPNSWVDVESSSAEDVYEETIYLEKGNYWVYVDYTMDMGNQALLFFDSTSIILPSTSPYSAPYEHGADGNVTVRLRNQYGFDFSPKFIKLEKGNSYTGYLADDDVAKATGEKISVVEQKAGKIEWLVKSGTSESNMVLTDEMYNLISNNVVITGDNIRLEGYTTINGAFEVDEYGNVKMFGGVININAQTWVSSTNYNFRVYDPSLLTYVMASDKTLEVGDSHYVDSFVRLTTDGPDPKIEVGEDTILTKYNLRVGSITMANKLLYLDNGYVRYTP